LYILIWYVEVELELKSNLSKILSVNSKFICDSTQLKLEVLKSDFQRKKERYEHAFNLLAINLQINW